MLLILSQDVTQDLAKKSAVSMADSVKSQVVFRKIKLIRDLTR